MDYDTITVVTLCLFASFVFSELFFRIRYPRVIGQILAGVLLGIPLFKAVFSPEILHDIDFLAELGIIFLLLLTGLQLNVDKFKRSGRDTVIIALFSVAVPFLFGFVLMKAIGYSNLVAFVTGSALSLTAEGTKLKVLLDMRALNTRVGVVMLGAGILDDAFEILFLSAVLVLAHESVLSLVKIPFNLLLFIAFIVVVYKAFPFVFRYVQREHSRVASFSFVLLFALFVAMISTKLELGPIIGAFIAGIIIHLTEKETFQHKENVKELQAMTFAFIIPFFFINIGLHFDFSKLVSDPWLMLSILFVATVSKIVGALLATPFTDLNLRQTHLIGWGMNSRGAIELVIAEVARINGLIPIEVYSALVFMAVITTLIFPIVLKVIVSHDRSILN